MKKANQKVHGLEKELKNTKAELSDARNTVEITIGQRNKEKHEVIKLHKVAYGEVFQKVFDRGYEWAGDSYEMQVGELRSGIF